MSTLKKDFLRKLSDWTSEQYAARDGAMESAAKRFGMNEYLESVSKKSEQDRNDLFGAFSEFMVFENRPKFFYDKTGLEYFCLTNPLQLSDKDLSEYKQMLDFEVGIFNVSRVEVGKGFFVNTLKDQSEVFVNDINISKDLKLPASLWCRIAKVNDDYNVISSNAFCLPSFKIGKEIINIRKVTVSEICKIVFKKDHKII